MILQLSDDDDILNIVILIMKKILQQSDDYHEIDFTKNLAYQKLRGLIGANVNFQNRQIGIHLQH